MVWIYLAIILIIYIMQRITAVLELHNNLFGLVSYLTSQAQITNIKGMLSGEPDSIDAYVNDRTNDQLKGLTIFLPTWKSVLKGFFYLKPKHVLVNSDMLEFIPDRFPSAVEVSSINHVHGYYLGVMAQQIGKVDEIGNTIEQANQNLKDLSNRSYNAEI